MEDTVIIVVVCSCVIFCALVIGGILYSLFWYKKWKISTPNQRRRFALNHTFSKIEMVFANQRTRNENRTSHTRTSDQTQNEQNNNGNTSDVTSSGLAFSNRSLRVAVVNTNSVDLSLESPVSPIRASAERYSVVDLNDDT
ncbi:hypothetical protein ACF0H5_011646 [Mactra antiquata]